jgi:G patch domain-containing protein 1
MHLYITNMQKKVSYQVGTPFEDETETTITGRGLMPWEQKVRDERTGKRKFHGAFTGGFSAGYKNTCGSEIGFTPSQFKSSRSSRAVVKQQITDFMDEEDLGEIHLGSNLVTKDDYQSFNLDSNLAASAEESIGAKLYHQMKGGREEPVKKRIYGPTMPPIAPEMVEGINVEPKVNLYGLGYRSDLQPESELPIKQIPQAKASKSKPAEKVRSMFKMSSEVYDEDYNFSKELDSGSDMEVETSEQPKRETRLGVNDIPGFTLALTESCIKRYKAPRVPRNYNPRHFLMQLKAYTTHTPKKLTSDQRGKIIEDKKPQALCANFISDSDIEKLKNVKSFVKGTQMAGYLKEDQEGLPFGDDTAKQERYYRFICSHEGIEVGGVLPTQMMTASQLRQEREEFLIIYNQRKESRSSTDSIMRRIEEKKREISRWAERTTEAWKPERLLCQRFNVPEPVVTVIESKPVSNFDEKFAPTVRTSEKKIMTEDTRPLIFQEEGGYSDLFRSIFEASDQDDRSEEEAENEMVIEDLKIGEKRYR